MNFKSGLAVVSPIAAERKACLAGVSRQGRFQEGAGFGYHRPMAENRHLTQALARLDALTDWERRPRNTMRVGLEPMRDLAARLGNPQKSFRSIHVAGTKGKGSVSDRAKRLLR